MRTIIEFSFLLGYISPIITILSFTVSYLANRKRLENTKAVFLAIGIVFMIPSLLFLLLKD